jgi:hypothetical protein
VAASTNLDHGLPHELGIKLANHNFLLLRIFIHWRGILDEIAVELLDRRYDFGHGECLSR